MEVLSLVRSMKNSFTPINRIPTEVLLLIPDYWKEDVTDQDLIVLTHVCRGWRSIFTSLPSLWSFLDCRNVDKTRAYIERSKSVPLEIGLIDPHVMDAFLLTVPHISRLKHLTIFTGDFPAIVNHFFCRAPLLEVLDVSLRGSPGLIPSDAFLDGDLSSLRVLILAGVITHLPWKNLTNLTTFSLTRVLADQISITQILNFLENSPLLHPIGLEDSLPNSSDAPPNPLRAFCLISPGSTSCSVWQKSTYE